MLAAEELQPLLELAVLVVGHEVDGAHAFELGPQLLVSHPDVFEITGRIVGGEQHFHAVHRVTSARLLEELFTPNPTFRLPEIELVNA